MLTRYWCHTFSVSSSDWPFCTWNVVRMNYFPPHTWHLSPWSHSLLPLDRPSSWSFLFFSTCTILFFFFISQSLTHFDVIVFTQRETLCKVAFIKCHKFINVITLSMWPIRNVSVIFRIIPKALFYGSHFFHSINGRGTMAPILYDFVGRFMCCWTLGPQQGCAVGEVAETLKVDLVGGKRSQRACLWRQTLLSIMTWTTSSSAHRPRINGAKHYGLKSLKP
jgi:hypothetical protein